MGNPFVVVMMEGRFRWHLASRARLQEDGPPTRRNWAASYPVLGIPPDVHVSDKSVSFSVLLYIFCSVFALKFPEMHLVGEPREIS